MKTKVIVSATGPFSSHLGPEENMLTKRVCFTKGVHLVLPSLTTENALLLTARSDGRVFFCLPWYGKTLVGTTDTFFDSSPDSVLVKPEEVEYLLGESNRYFGHQWSLQDICGSFAGIRVLKKVSPLSPSKLSRDWRLTVPVKGLFSPVGGKFTTARKEADEIVRAVFHSLHKTAPPCTTGVTMFPWSPEHDYLNWKEEVVRQGCFLGLDGETANLCASRYGTTVVDLYALIEEESGLKKRIHPDFPFCQAEIIHAVQKEMAGTIEDVLRRRIPLSLLTVLDKETVTVTAELAGRALHWSMEKKGKEVRRYLSQERWTSF